MNYVGADDAHVQACLPSPATIMRPSILPVARSASVRICVARWANIWGDLLAFKEMVDVGDRRLVIRLELHACQDFA
jgi:hypothetical protein